MKQKKASSIPLSRKGIIAELWRVLPLTVFTIAVTIYLLIISRGQPFFSFYTHAANILVCILLLYWSLQYIKKLQDGNPGVIIDSSGIVFNLPYSQFGKITWIDIKQIRVGRLFRERYLGISVKKPAKYISNGPWFSRVIFRIFPGYYSTILYVTPKIYDISFEKLVDLINMHYEESKNAYRLTPINSSVKR